MKTKYVKSFIEPIDFDKTIDRTDGKKGKGLEEVCEVLDRRINCWVKENIQVRIDSVFDIICHSPSSSERAELSWDGNGLYIEGYILRNVLYEEGE